MLLNNTRINQYSCTLQFTILLLVSLFLNNPEISAQEQPDQSVELQQLVSKVKQNEALYQNLQFKLNATEIDQAELIEYEGSKPIKRQSTISFIRQGKKFRQQIHTQGRFVLNFTLGLYWLQDGYRASDPAEIHTNETWIRVESGTRENLSLFDGTTFRSFWKESMSDEENKEPPRNQKRGLISDSPSGTLNQTSPHRFLFDSGQLPVSLSSFLTGKEAEQAITGKSALTARVTKLGTETFQGLVCTTLQLETFDSTGKPRSRTNLWLSQDRNLIPVRREDFNYHVSKELPISASLVEAWQEVSPGVWFPNQAHTEYYRAREGKRNSEQKPSRRKEYTLESIELNPQLPTDIFTKLDFEAGTPVSVVTDGIRVKHFRQGTEK
ncbi:MAG: hypothetical protein CME31_27760 [Gimesia sp.]|jgi:hypothetical protein|nr:hypothetical protein [Gimesia sp.]|tara:strand:- start:96885 stop:98030 length:1146 start_codon:yes stop_codon:yes gene_type:complete